MLLEILKGLQHLKFSPEIKKSWIFFSKKRWFVVGKDTRNTLYTVQQLYKAKVQDNFSLTFSSFPFLYKAFISNL